MKFYIERVFLIIFSLIVGTVICASEPNVVLSAKKCTGTRIEDIVSRCNLGHWQRSYNLSHLPKTLRNIAAVNVEFDVNWHCEASNTGRLKLVINGTPLTDKIQQSGGNKDRWQTYHHRLQNFTADAFKIEITNVDTFQMLRNYCILSIRPPRYNYDKADISRYVQLQLSSNAKRKNKFKANSRNIDLVNSSNAEIDDVKASITKLGEFVTEQRSAFQYTAAETKTSLTSLRNLEIDALSIEDEFLKASVDETIKSVKDGLTTLLFIQIQGVDTQSIASDASYSEIKAFILKQVTGKGKALLSDADKTAKTLSRMNALSTSIASSHTRVASIKTNNDIVVQQLKSENTSLQQEWNAVNTILKQFGQASLAPLN